MPNPGRPVCIYLMWAREAGTVLSNGVGARIGRDETRKTVGLDGTPHADTQNHLDC